MVVFKKKFYLFQVTDTWFNHKFKFNDLYTFKVYSYVNKPIQHQFLYKKEISHTLILSLLQSNEDIFSGFRATYKNEINKAVKRGVQTKFINDIDLFVSLYNDFAQSKNIYPVRKKILENIGNNLQLSFAYFDNSPVAAHAYITDIDSGITRLYLSGSQRFNNYIDKNLVGYANKLLMYDDMLHFKELNYKTFDFGGYALNTKNKSLQGINDFKESFGGEINVCDSYYTYLYYYLKRITEKLDKRYS